MDCNSLRPSVFVGIDCCKINRKGRKAQKAKFDTKLSYKWTENPLRPLRKIFARFAVEELIAKHVKKNLIPI